MNAVSHTYGLEEAPAMDGPYSYAKRLAAYITDATAIYHDTKRNFGTSPCLATIKSYQNARKFGERQVGEAIGFSRSEEIARDRMQEASKALAGSIRKQAGYDWPCGHSKAPENTHTIKGEKQCKRCRRIRWNEGFREAVRERVRRYRAGKKKSLNTILATKDMLRGGDGQMPADRLCEALEEMFDVQRGALKSKSRVKMAVLGRVVLTRILYQRGLSFMSIGRYLSRDHSSIVYYHKMFDYHAARDNRVIDAFIALGDKG